MSIEESFEWLISRKEHYEMDDNCQELAQALDVAIDTMRKYQKIQKVMDSRADDDAKSNSKALSEIEVIMYGDND